MTEAHVTIEKSSSGLSCKIECPECNSSLTMSSYVNENTGKQSFSTNNFTRHFTIHRNAQKADHQDDPSSSRFHSVISGNLSTYELKKQIESKDVEIAGFKERVKILQENIDSDCAHCESKHAEIAGFKERVKILQEKIDSDCAHFELLKAKIEENSILLANYEKRLKENESKNLNNHLLDNYSNAITCANCTKLENQILTKNASIETLETQLALARNNGNLVKCGDCPVLKREMTEKNGLIADLEGRLQAQKMNLKPCHDCADLRSAMTSLAQRGD